MMREPRLGWATPVFGQDGLQAIERAIRTVVARASWANQMQTISLDTQTPPRWRPHHSRNHLMGYLSSTPTAFVTARIPRVVKSKIMAAWVTSRPTKDGEMLGAKTAVPEPIASRNPSEPWSGGVFGKNSNVLK